ncbi:MAG: hypothetical protein M3O26_18005 [Pseudomonadota bacterium]|nr:hypothetical protein [Pseudomonadota bacterium]
MIGNDPTKWRTGIRTYGRVGYSDVYPGVDLVYYGTQGRLEYDFTVAPGASAAPIRLAFDGADQLTIDERLVAGEPITRRHSRAPPLIAELVRDRPLEGNLAIIRFDFRLPRLLTGALLKPKWKLSRSEDERYIQQPVTAALAASAVGLNCS